MNSIWFDSDWCGDVDDQKKYSGIHIIHGKYNIHMTLKEPTNRNFVYI